MPATPQDPSAKTTPIRAFFERRLPDAILRVTDPIAFGAPRIPPADAVLDEVRARGDDALRDSFAAFRDAGADMNARCGTAAPTSSLILTIAAILKGRLSGAEAAYLALLVLAGVSVLAAITGQSVSVLSQRVGLSPRAQDVEPVLVALRRKEAWARVASGLAAISLIILAIVALISSGR